MQVKQNLDKAVWDKLQRDYVGYLQLHPKMTPTEKFILLNRTMEKAHYGVTMRDLARGYEIDYVEDEHSGRFLEVQSQVRGVVKVGGAGNNNPGTEPTVAFHRTSWRVANGKPMSYMQLVQDKEIKREINLAASEHTTATDIAGAGTALLEHEGIDTGFGATPGVITPYFVDTMMRKFAEKTVFKNFVRQFPMPGMAFYFPLKTTIPSDDSGVAHDVMPTAEGRAGLDVAISFDKFYVNGWKFLRHAVFTDELLDLLSGFIPIQAEYVEDMGEMMALLWDYAIIEGLWQMLWSAKWWRPDVSGAAWAASEYVPLSGASGVNILGDQAYKHYVWQDIGTGSTGGKLFTPHHDVTPTPTEYLTATLREFSTTSDTSFELALAMATLLKDKHSKLEFICWPSKITEFMARDSRFLETIQATGNPEFQSESGYLGQIAIGGTNGRVDIWEYDAALSQSTKETGDVGTYTILPVFGGRYGTTWNLGMYSPLYMRVDEGMEAVLNRGTGDSETLRPNETRMVTAGTKGASFPGNYQDLVMGLCVEDNHG